jgi:hypothetical protein
MYRGLLDWQTAVNKATRLEGLWVCSNLIAAVYATAGKSYERPPSARTIFEQLTGEPTGPPEVEPEDDGDGGSLAAAIAERKAKELGDQIQH